MFMQLTGGALMADWFENTIDLWGQDVAWLVGTNVDYAIDQEFGTVHQSGTPHLRPAADLTNAKMAGIAVDADGIEDFVRKSALYLNTETKRLAPVDTGNLRASYSAERIR